MTIFTPLSCFYAFSLSLLSYYLEFNAWSPEQAIINSQSGTESITSHKKLSHSPFKTHREEMRMGMKMNEHAAKRIFSAAPHFKGSH